MPISVLLHTGDAPGDLRAEISSALSDGGVGCEVVDGGVVATLGADVPGTAARAKVAVVRDGELDALCTDDVADVVVWPRDRKILALRVRSILGALRASVERDVYRAILDASPAMILAKSKRGDFLFANRAMAATIYGTDPAALVGKQSRDMQPSAEARDAIEAAQSALYSGGVPVDFEALLGTVDGPRLIRTNLALGDSRHGDEIVVANAYDVTAERAEQAEFLRQHELLRQVLDASPGLIFVKDAEGRFVLVNAALARLLGRPQEELVGSRPDDVHDVASELQEWRASEERAARARVPIVAESLFTTRDGTVLRFLLVRCAYEDNEGQKRILSIGTDITARRQAEESLEQYRAMVEMSRTLALVTDSSGAIVRASRAWLEAFGYPEYALVGTSLFDLFHPEDRPKRPPAGETADSLNGAEVRCRASDGTFRRLAWSIAVDAHKNRGYAVAHDVTALREAERAAELARKNAVEASRIKSQFVANMSHEIRTPMNGVLGMVALALETDLDDEQRDYLKAAHDSAEALLVVINDVLDISKIEAGRLVLEQVPFKVRDVVDTALVPLLLRAKQKGLSTRVFIDDAVPSTVAGDPLRFRQVLVNLVGNAVKFTEQGVISIRVRIDETNPENLHVAVADTGIGVENAKHDSIFEAFRQSNESTTRTHGGTGLGLSICRDLTRLMGGEIWVESEPGCGSTFHFTAHLPKTQDVVASPSSQQSSPKATSDKRLRVLLADDNAVNTTIGARWIQKNGCDVLTAVNGRAAVEIAAREQFDLILMDVQMPVMDGFEATRAIRAREPAGTRVPIVALTASAMKEDERRCLAAGMDGHLAKPLDHVKLAEVIARVRRGSASGAVPTPRPMAVNLPIMRERCDNDATLIREVVGAYQESFHTGYSTLVTAKDNGDMAAARRAAHQLRGTFLYVAANSAATLADRIEHIDDDDRVSLDGLVTELGKEADLVRTLLIQEAQKPSVAPLPAE